jgi:predicted phosphodiesterase
MTVAILSDIHGNLAALERVLEECDALGVKRILCLGDVIGYGPDPVAVTQIAMQRFEVSLLGNHEEALITGKHRFNKYAAAAIDWTREQITAASTSRGWFARDGVDYMQWYRKRRPVDWFGDWLLVHGSIYDPVHDYVEQIQDPEAFIDLIDTLENDFEGFSVCLAGHNHVPFLATRLGCMYPHDGHRTFTLPEGEKAYVCIGSVGQPRDGDNRASFVTIEENRVTYHRLVYDIEVTMGKIIEAGLPDYLAKRLRRGR